MAADQILLVRTAQQLYAIRRSDVLSIRLITSDHDLCLEDQRGRPCDHAELSVLMGLAETERPTRWQALIVPFRRRMVALLVESVELLEDSPTIVPLPDLLRMRLREPWANGALLVDGQVIVQLDLRALAMSAVIRSR